MYNKTIIDFGFDDIRIINVSANVIGPAQPTASANNAYLIYIDN